MPAQLIVTKPKLKQKRTAGSLGSSSQTQKMGGSRNPNEPLFFFKPNEPYGEFCQWYPATFTVSKAEMSVLVGHPIDQDDPEGWQRIYFNCAEQFMMYLQSRTVSRLRNAELGSCDSRPQGTKTISEIAQGIPVSQLGRDKKRCCGRWKYGQIRPEQGTEGPAFRYWKSTAG
jgi:hypothetical protein